MIAVGEMELYKPRQGRDMEIWHRSTSASVVETIWSR
jgi:hypothetical protein